MEQNNIYTQFPSNIFSLSYRQGAGLFNQDWVNDNWPTTYAVYAEVRRRGRQ